MDILHINIESLKEGTIMVVNDLVHDYICITIKLISSTWSVTQASTWTRNLYS